MFKMYGVVPPMVTPFKTNGDLDEDGLKILVDYLKEKVHGLFICGSYGGGPLMDIAERKKVTEITLKANQGKVDIIVHVGTTNTKMSVDLTRHAVQEGVQAVAAVGPYYFKHNRDSILSFYEDLVKAARDTPVYVYNNTNFQGYPMDVKLIEDLKNIGVHGVKDATFNIMEHAAYHRKFSQDFDIVLGTEGMFCSASVLGTKAFIPGLGNAFPEINVQMFEEAMRGDYVSCRETQFKINQIRETMYLAKSTQLAVYTMLELRKVIKTYPRKPFLPATETEKENIGRSLKELGML